jgi:hypothetical protein
MKNEQWLPIVGYEQNYEVSDYGRVRSIARPACAGGLLALSPTKQGYARTSLWQRGKRASFLVHRLVLEAFNGPCPNGLEAAHLNGNRSDNALSNLIWATRKENHSHKIIHGTQQFGSSCYNAKLSDDSAREIRRLRGIVAGAELSRRYNIAASIVSAIQLGKSWRRI